MAEWVFRQLAGDKKVLKLDGWSAPMGRPRQSPVVTDGLDIRIQDNYYAGKSAPTRHIFGRKYSDLQITGRFRDRAFYQGYAKDKVQEVKSFVSDAQQCLITWGTTMQVVGIIQSFNPARESEGEVEYNITIKVDYDKLAVDKKEIKQSKTPPNYSSAIAKFFTEAFKTPPVEPKMKGSILDALESGISLITGAVGEMQSVADQITSFEKATFAEFGRLISTIGAARQVALSLRDIYLNVPAQTQLLSQRAEDQIALLNAQAIANSSLAAALKEMAEFEQTIERTRAGQIKSIYTAKTGDTWESISVLFYNSPDRAADLRAANDNIEKPVPGLEYFIPR